MNRVALITGAAVRLGAATARLLHEKGFNVVIHCNNSTTAADELCHSLNAKRENSAIRLQAELGNTQAVAQLAEAAITAWGRLDVLVNNASAFYPVALDEVNENHWDTLFASNAKGPLFLAKACRDALIESKGCIINISDVHARRGLSKQTIYIMAKSALEGMTRSLARELAPQVRVNAVAPGAILWASGVEDLSDAMKEKIIEQSFLKRMGDPSDIANTVWFLVDQGSYITGQIISVDGGR